MVVVGLADDTPEWGASGACEVIYDGQMGQGWHAILRCDGEQYVYVCWEGISAKKNLFCHQKTCAFEKNNSFWALMIKLKNWTVQ